MQGRSSAFDRLDVDDRIDHHFDKRGERRIQSLADRFIEIRRVRYADSQTSCGCGELGKVWIGKDHTVLRVTVFFLFLFDIFELAIVEDDDCDGEVDEGFPDADADGTADCSDACPNDSNKIEPANAAAV